MHQWPDDLEQAPVWLGASACLGLMVGLLSRARLYPVGAIVVQSSVFFFVAYALMESRMFSLRRRFAGALLSKIVVLRAGGGPEPTALPCGDAPSEAESLTKRRNRLIIYATLTPSG